MRTWLIALTVTAGATAFMAIADPLPPDASYRPLPTEPLDVVRRDDEAARAAVMRRQLDLLNERCDVSNRPLSGVMDVRRPQGSCRAACVCSYVR